MASQTHGNIETASWMRRIAALFVDWFASILVVIAVFGIEAWQEPRGIENVYVLGVYVLETALLTWLANGSFGKLVTGLRVVSHRGGELFNPLTLLIRQLLVVLVIPPLVFKPDGRGLHDLFAGTATVTTAQFKKLQAG